MKKVISNFIFIVSMAFCSISIYAIPKKEVPKHLASDALNCAVYSTYMIGYLNGVYNQYQDQKEISKGMRSASLSLGRDVYRNLKYYAQLYGMLSHEKPKQVMKDISGGVDDLGGAENATNIEVDFLTKHYGDMCHQLSINPKKRMQYWLSKAPDNPKH
ncbi:hypothetical protein D5018_11845 [Parashewanella curva]|uniref:Uncharacterized protein n=1 Tax=Parashewanella curva TaxID=2338552 RepID=A0A3L8PZG4_9GAMM|nr:hypothetical protein [Parashewanella curva]RLV59472.1 hypothetical protein D5018_11845 [Parashewanella curva]